MFGSGTLDQNGRNEPDIRQEEEKGEIDTRKEKREPKETTPTHSYLCSTRITPIGQPF